MARVGNGKIQKWQDSKIASVENGKGDKRRYTNRNVFTNPEIQILRGIGGKKLEASISQSNPPTSI